jgi:hypothetical protein
MPQQRLTFLKEEQDSLFKQSFFLLQQLIKSMNMSMSMCFTALLRKNNTQASFFSAAAKEKQKQKQKKEHAAIRSTFLVR